MKHRTVVIVDPSVDKMRGHMRRLVASFADGFIASGRDVVVLTNRRYAGPDFHNCITKRVFTYSSYVDYDPRITATFKEELSAWSREHGSSDALLVYPTVTDRIIEGIGEWIGQAPKQFFHVIVMLLEVGVAGKTERPFVVDHDAFERFRAGFELLAGAGPSVMIAASSNTMASYVRFVCPLPVEEVAPPFSLSNNDPGDPRPERVEGRGEYRLGLYLGPAAAEKGFYNLPSVIEMIAAAGEADWRGARAIIHAYGGRQHADAIRRVLHAVEVAPTGNRFKVRTARDEDGRYERLVRSLDAVVLAYDEKRYAGKTSGIFWEARSIGLPVAIPARTWMAMEALRSPGEAVMIESFGARQTFEVAARLAKDRPAPATVGLPLSGAAEAARQILARVAELEQTGGPKKPHLN